MAEGRVSRRSLHPPRALLTGGHLGKGKPRRKNFKKNLLSSLNSLLFPSSSTRVSWDATAAASPHWGSLTGLVDEVLRHPLLSPGPFNLTKHWTSCPQTGPETETSL